MTDATPAELGAALSAMDADKEEMLHAHLRSIAVQIVNRELIGSERTLLINDDLSTVTHELLRLTHTDECLPDYEQKERLLVFRDTLRLKAELRQEQRDTWRDVQALGREQREVERELLTLTQSRARTARLGWDPAA